MHFLFVSQAAMKQIKFCEKSKICAYLHPKNAVPNREFTRDSSLIKQCFTSEHSNVGYCETAKLVAQSILLDVFPTAHTE